MAFYFQKTYRPDIEQFLRQYYTYCISRRNLRGGIHLRVR